MSAPQGRTEALPQPVPYGMRWLPAGLSRTWLVTALVVFVAAGTFVLLWPSAASLVGDWRDTNRETYTHGFAIAGIALWIMVRNRSELGRAVLMPDMRASALFVLAAIGWLIAVRAGVEVLHQSGLPILTWLAVCAMFGVAVARIAAFPIAYLYFSIPLWDFFNSALQAATVAVVGLLLRITSLPSYVDGNMVHLASGTFEIAGGCSGLHFFIVGLALAALYGEVGRDTVKVRLQLIALALFLTLVANWVRVYTIILAGYLTDMQHYLVRVEHNRYGWIVFAVMMVVFFVASRAIPASPERADRDPAEPRAGQRDASVTRLVGALAAVVAVPMFQLLLPSRPATLPERQALLPGVPAGWSGPLAPWYPDWSPVFAGADAAELVGFRSASDRHVDVFVAAYASQAQGKELIGYGNSLLGASDGRVVSRSHVAGPAVELVVERRGQREIVRYYYQVDATRTDRDLPAQLLYGARTLTGRPLMKIVAFRTSCAADCEAARAELTTASATPAQSTDL